MNLRLDLTVVLLLAAVVLGSCGAPARRTRSRLADGDLAGAIDVAGRDRRALEAIALDVLRLGLSEADTQRGAAAGFRAAGGLAEDTLRELADAPVDDSTRALALEALHRLGVRSARSRLQSLAEHDNPTVRATAIRALAATIRSRQVLERWLVDSDDSVRAAAVRAVAQRASDPWALEVVSRSARDDESWTVRAAAVSVLPRLTRGAVLIEVASAVLQRSDNPATARLAAISALGRADSIQDVEALLLARLEAGSPAESVRAAAILASYGSEAGHAHLRQALASRNVMEAREAAVAAGRIGGPLVEVLLMALHRPEPDVRLHVAEALLRTGERETALSALSVLMGDSGWTGLHAALALARGRDGSSAAAIRLAAALDNEAPEIRRYAVFACGSLEFGFDLALNTLADEAAEVRVAAAGALLRHFHRSDLSRGRQSVMIPRPRLVSSFATPH